MRPSASTLVDMRYMALDMGMKRTGVAVGTDVVGVASPVRAIETASETERLRQIADEIEAHAPDALVVGLPLNMDGTAGPAASQVRGIAQQLAERFHLPVHLVDERLSSEAANAQMAQTGLTHKQKKARRDALAAATILRKFFEAECQGLEVLEGGKR